MLKREGLTSVRFVTKAFLAHMHLILDERKIEKEDGKVFLKCTHL